MLEDDQDGPWTPKPTLKILFLDIDGPLIPGRGWICEGRAWKTPDPIAGAFISALVRRGGVQLVLSSRWRYCEKLETTMEMFAKVGITGDDFHEDWKTPVMHDEGRVKEIQAWLDAHLEVTHYASIDDMYLNMPNAVQCTTLDGILMDHQRELCEIFAIDMMTLKARAND